MYLAGLHFWVKSRKPMQDGIAKKISKYKEIHLEILTNTFAGVDLPGRHAGRMALPAL